MAVYSAKRTEPTREKVAKRYEHGEPLEHVTLVTVTGKRFVLTSESIVSAEVPKGSVA